MREYLIWFYRTIKQELRKGKYKSILRLYKKCYRKDIHRLCLLLKGKHFRTDISYIFIGNIRPSHEIVYTNWVWTLVQEAMAGKSLKKIKVIFNDLENAYTIVDGNHRLLAHKLLGHSMVECIVLKEIKE